MSFLVRTTYLITSVIVFIALPTTAFAGSQTYSTPGTHTFTVPNYTGTLNVTVNGAGGGGGDDDEQAGAGSASRFYGTVIGNGGQGSGSSDGTEQAHGEPGAASGGNVSNTTGGGAAGGTGNAGWYPGGSGGKAVSGYTSGTLPASVPIVVGAGGAGARGGVSGQNGSVTITWNDVPPPPPPAATPPADTLSCNITFDKNPIKQGETTKIRWSSTRADAFYVKSIGYVGSAGSASVAPTQTTDYSGTVYSCPDGYTLSSDRTECNTTADQGSTMGTSGSQKFSKTGTYTFTVPNNVTEIDVSVIGAGGGGGSGAYAGGCGGAGSTQSGHMSVTPGHQYMIKIGAGGKSGGGGSATFGGGAVGGSTGGGVGGGMSAFLDGNTYLLVGAGGGGGSAGAETASFGFTPGYQGGGGDSDGNAAGTEYGARGRKGTASAGGAAGNSTAQAGSYLVGGAGGAGGYAGGGGGGGYHGGGGGGTYSLAGAPAGAGGGGGGSYCASSVSECSQSSGYSLGPSGPGFGSCIASSAKGGDGQVEITWTTSSTAAASQSVTPQTASCAPSILTVNCPTGQHFDSTTHQCVPDTTTCPAGHHWDTNLNQCMPDACPAGQVWDGIQCRSNCPIGKHWNAEGTQCVPDNCPLATYWDPLMRQCIPITQCPAGFSGTPPNCTASVCPPGFTGAPPRCSLAPTCPAGYVGTPPVCTLASNTCPAGYTGTPPNCSVASSCPLNYTGTPPNCTPIACVPTNICNGNNVVNSCTGALIQSCAYACASGACVVPPPSVVSWKVAPLVVNQGHTTNVSWEVRHVSSCTVSGTNGDSWTGLTGTKVSGPINAQTIFTLHCTALPGSGAPNVTRTATVNIVPVFQEK